MFGRTVVWDIDSHSDNLSLGHHHIKEEIVYCMVETNGKVVSSRDRLTPHCSILLGLYNFKET